MNFLLDNNLPPRLARGIDELSGAEHSVWHLRDRFDPATPDVDWLTELGEEEDWAVVSGDKRITRNKHERVAWMEAGLTAFFLEPGWSGIEFWEKASRLIHWWPTILSQATSIEAGVGFLVPVRGAKLKLLDVRS